MLKKMIPYTEGYRKWIFLGVLCSVGEAVFELLLPLIMADIVDVGIATGNRAYILAKGAEMILMSLVALAMGVSAAALASKAGMGFGAKLRKAEYDHVQEFSFSNIEKFSTASLITRLTSDVNSTQMTLMMGMRILVRAPVMLVTALVLAMTISLRLSRVFLVVIPLLLILVGIIIKVVGPMFTTLQECTDDVNLVVQEDLGAIRVVKSYVREKREKEKFAQRNNRLKESSEKAFGFVVVNMPLMMLIIYGTIIAVMWIGGHQVFAGAMGSGELISFFTYVTEILISLLMVSMVMMMLTRSIACARRIIAVLEEKPEITDEAADPALEVADGSVKFDHVYFKYNKDTPAWNLEDIQLSIRSGMTVGIIGGTGSAKSTLVSLIPRLYEATEGAVYVGGHNVKEYTMEHLRDACAMVLQKNTLFSGTVRENLRWGNEHATDEEIAAACRAACADEFINKMPDGYDTHIEQGGTNVSGGQKQRLCIARAILKQPKVLILDDSTSAVDTATDARIRRAFAAELKDTTKIIIAQRAASVCDADLIVVLDDGKISGAGTHEELLQSNEIYRDVYQSQQEGVSING